MLGQILVDRYYVRRALGSGGFGQTYVAIDTQDPARSECVVKLLLPANQDEDFLAIARRLFQSEAASLRRLGEHDQIPRLIDSFEDDGEFYLVQQYIEGSPFGDELIGGQRFSAEQVIDVLTDVLQILAFVHRHNVIHRDVKPNNLIRRPDGKLVLIDFGAVKELHTHLTTTRPNEETALTVGIGTQGYTPTEQLAGKPKFSSDLYALGMIAIQALTGLQPSQIPENPRTGELDWTHLVTIPPGLKVLLQKLTRQRLTYRYQSANEVLQDLQRLDTLPQEITLVDDLDLEQLPGLVDPKRGWRWGLPTIAIASLAAAGLSLGLRHLGAWESLDVATYDHLVRLEPDPGRDDRLLVVEITEADLQALQRVTPEDGTIAQAIANLQQHQPRVIGLDLYREIPQGEGHEDLLQALQAENLVAIAEIGDAGDQLQIPPPSVMRPEQVGFNDVVLDEDNVVRRNLMFSSLNGQPYYSLSLRVALQYLEAEGITPQAAPNNSEHLSLNGQVLPPLDHRVGGYHPIDAQGYQILLDYGSPTEVARSVTLTEVLDGTVDPSWIRDRIVLIGTTAASGKDFFQTPFSAVGNETQMPGVILHAHMTHQLLTYALDGRRVFWFWPNWAEVAWIIGWAIAGASLAWYVRRPLWLVGGGVGLILVIGGTTVGCFLVQGWVPAAGAISAYVLAGLTVVIYRLYWTQRNSEQIAAVFAPGQTMPSPHSSAADSSRRP